MERDASSSVLKSLAGVKKSRGPAGRYLCYVCCAERSADPCGPHVSDVGRIICKDMTTYMVQPALIGGRVSDVVSIGGMKRVLQTPTNAEAGRPADCGHFAVGGNDPLSHVLAGMVVRAPRASSCR